MGKRLDRAAGEAAAAWKAGHQGIRDRLGLRRHPAQGQRAQRRLPAHRRWLPAHRHQQLRRHPGGHQQRRADRDPGGLQAHRHDPQAAANDRFRRPSHHPGRQGSPRPLRAAPRRADGGGDGGPGAGRPPAAPAGAVQFVVKGARQPMSTESTHPWRPCCSHGSMRRCCRDQ